MKVLRTDTTVREEEVTPEDYGKELAGLLYWQFNTISHGVNGVTMTNEEAQACLDAFVVQLYKRFNLQGYDLKKPF